MISNGRRECSTEAEFHAHVSFSDPIGSVATIKMGQCLKWASVRSLHECDGTLSRGEKGSARCHTALRFGPEPTQGSPAGTTVAAVGGRPITTGGSSSTGRAMPDQCATNCVAFVRAMPRSSTSKQSSTILLSTWYRRCEREAVGRFACGDLGPTSSHKTPSLSRPPPLGNKGAATTAHPCERAKALLKKVDE